MSQSSTAAIVPVHVVDQSLVRPAASIGEIEEVFKEYRALCERLLDDNDYQQIGSKKFRKKSGWRTLSTAMGVTLKHVERDIVYDDHGRVLRAEFVAQAIAPNGRTMDGWASCDLFEKCCPFGCSRNHSHCPAATGDKCSGAIHWSHPNHDIPATAETRAKNRASSDLFGMGEVSAEEIVGSGEEVPEERQGPKCPACSSGLWDNRPRIAAGTMNERAPKWKCKNRECTANNGEPWVSWHDDPAASGDRPKWLAELCEKATVKEIVAWGAEIAGELNVKVEKIEHLYKAPPDVQKALADKVARQTSSSDVDSGASHPAGATEPREGGGGSNSAQNSDSGAQPGSAPSPEAELSRDELVDLIDKASKQIVHWGEVAFFVNGPALAAGMSQPPGTWAQLLADDTPTEVLQHVVDKLKLAERVGVDA